MTMQTIVVQKIDNRFDLRQLINWFTHQRDGAFRVEVTRIRKQRTHDQNAWLWGCIYPLLRQALNAEGWDFSTDEQVHEFFKQRVAGESVVNFMTGETVKLPTSTKEMDTVAFAAYCDRLREYGRDYLGIDIPEPTTIMTCRGGREC